MNGEERGGRAIMSLMFVVWGVLAAAGGAAVWGLIWLGKKVFG